MIISQYGILSRTGLVLFAIGWKASYAHTVQNGADRDAAKPRLYGHQDPPPSNNFNKKEKASAGAEA